MGVPYGGKVAQNKALAVGRGVMRSLQFIRLALCLCALSVAPLSAHAQAWKNCIPNSIGPGGCDSIGPGGGKSIGPGGGLSIGPGGGLSIGPEGGQSIGPGGGRSVGPGGGLSINRDWSKGLDPDTLRPAPNAGPYEGLIAQPPLRNTSKPK